MWCKPGAAADNGTATYSSNVTNGTYMLNTTPANFLDAETNCRLNGGHLTSYASAEEQRDVEAYFVNTGAWVLWLGPCMTRSQFSVALQAARHATLPPLL